MRREKKKRQRAFFLASLPRITRLFHARARPFTRRARVFINWGQSLFWSVGVCRGTRVKDHTSKVEAKCRGSRVKCRGLKNVGGFFHYHLLFIFFIITFLMFSLFVS